MSEYYPIGDRIRRFQQMLDNPLLSWTDKEFQETIEALSKMQNPTVRDTAEVEELRVTALEAIELTTDRIKRIDMREIVGECDKVLQGTAVAIKPLHFTGKDIELAKLFYLLKTTTSHVGQSFISNSNEQIAEFISKGFGLNYTTVLSYLEHPNEKLASAKNILQGVR